MMTKKIAVFTPTYNRKELLNRLYNSLVQQTVLDFEWVVVDDDSTDGTDEWFDSIISEAPFFIKYQKIKHGGKHRAINVGVKLSEAEFIYIVDSDDYLPYYSIDQIIRWIDDINHRDDIAGVSGLMIYENGEVVGQAPKIKDGEYVECTNLERYRLDLLGDKAEVYKTSVLRANPFPEFENEFFITERMVWDKVASEGYKIRWYNTPIYICEYQSDGLSMSGANSLNGHIKNYNGYVAFVKQSMRIMEPLEKVTYFREYNRVAKYKKIKISERSKELGMSIISYICFLLFKMPLLYLKRQFLFNKSSKT